MGLGHAGGLCADPRERSLLRMTVLHEAHGHSPSPHALSAPKSGGAGRAQITRAGSGLTKGGRLKCDMCCPPQSYAQPLAFLLPIRPNTYALCAKKKCVRAWGWGVYNPPEMRPRGAACLNIDTQPCPEGGGGGGCWWVSERAPGGGGPRVPQHTNLKMIRMTH